MSVVHQLRILIPRNDSLLPIYFLFNFEIRGSSGGDLGDVTPCNASPNLSALMSFRPILRDDAEEAWRRRIVRMLNLSPSNTLQTFQRLNILLKVSFDTRFLTNRLK